MTNSIKLDASDLLSKWGFEDGELATELLHNWVPSSQWCSHFEENKRNQHIINYLNPVALQAELILRYLKPLLPKNPPSKLERVYTIHNPIRLEPIITETSPSYEDLISELENQLQLFKAVEVTEKQIFAICEEIYPFKPKGWVALYSTLAHQFKFLSNLSQEMAHLEVHEETFMRNEPYVILKPYINALSEVYNDEHLFIASEIVSNSTDAAWQEITAEKLNSALDSATLLLK
ncbi:MAG: hypothetical protein ACKOW9_02250 [Candidatus Paceibacterota bacterium]